MLIFIGFLIVLILWVSENRRYRWFYIMAKTARRDLRALTTLYKLYRYVNQSFKQNKTLKRVFDKLAKSQPDKIAFYFEDEAWSYAKVTEFSNQVARYFIGQGLKRGDSVALILENRPEYPCIYLGLSTFGAVTALINIQLVKDPLLHSITTTKCKAIIFGSQHSQSIEEISGKIEGIRLYQLHEDVSVMTEIISGAIDLRAEFDKTSGTELEENYQQGQSKDPAIYIFTSGTTGLPKASVLTNIRCLMLAKGIEITASLKSDDIVYIPLPFYHVSGANGIGQMIVCGHSVIIKNKFSASNYFKDCSKYNATAGLYIGEMCRYMLAASDNTTPIKHTVRTMIGNGLRPQIWKKFVDKFEIQNVIEFYGATEGISNIVNFDNREGAVGFVPPYMRTIFPVMLIKCNELTGEPIRNKKGFCEICETGEPGLAVGKIQRESPVFNFEGYTDKQATNKKILQDVLKKGDMFFNSGDILFYDEFGYFYFKDRTGDTFRWKGENVSTSEVEAVISNIVHLSDVAVYGVEIPGSEGKAGMAAVVDTDKKLDMSTFGNKLKALLPSYAIPLFIRVVDSVSLTSTFKLKKNDLKNEAYCIEKITDDIYFFSSASGQYVPFTKDISTDLSSGRLRL